MATGELAAPLETYHRQDAVLGIATKIRESRHRKALGGRIVIQHEQQLRAGNRIVAA